MQAARQQRQGILKMRWERIGHLLEPSEPAPAVHHTDQEGQEQVERDTYRSKTYLQTASNLKAQARRASGSGHESCLP